MLRDKQHVSRWYPGVQTWAAALWLAVVGGWRRYRCPSPDPGAELDPDLGGAAAARPLISVQSWIRIWAALRRPVP